MDQTLNGADPATDPARDPVAAAVEQVRADLEARRASGELPELPSGELDRQFSAVIEAADGTFIEEAPLDTEGLAGLAQMATWEPSRAGLRGKVTGRLRALWSRVVGAIVRRQVAPFAQRTTVLVEQLTHRQNVSLRFLGHTHLDRVRGLEYRVAQLEQEVERLRAAQRDATGDDPEGT